MHVYVVTGHYGAGKTNVCVNLAMALSGRGDARVSVVDLDTVNPYFRTADFKELFQERNVRLVSSVYANSNLDTPAITFGIESIVREGVGTDDSLVVDVGGDDTGATALGQFAEVLSAYDQSLDVFYVVNYYRYLTRDPNDALTLMRDVEAASRLKHTGIVNNSNLGSETTIDVVEASKPFAEELSKASGLPIVATCYPSDAYGTVKGEGAFCVQRYVMPIWERN
jgi:hypothetical protein